MLFRNFQLSGGQSWKFCPLREKKSTTLLHNESVSIIINVKFLCVFLRLVGARYLSLALIYKSMLVYITTQKFW